MKRDPIAKQKSVVDIVGEEALEGQRKDGYERRCRGLECSLVSERANELSEPRIDPH